MSTRSLIGKLNGDGTVTAVYCHWNGHPEHNGRTLAEHYQEPAKIDALLALGDLSELGAEIGEQHDFNRHDYDDTYRGWCLAYGRDRGESGTAARSLPSVSEYWAAIGLADSEYLYLYADAWWVCEEDQSPRLLRDALAVLAERP